MDSKPVQMSSIRTSSLLKKSASGVLASLRGSTYRGVRLASSLAAALLDSLFEHPASDPALSTYLLSVDLAAPCWAAGTVLMKRTGTHLPLSPITIRLRKHCAYFLAPLIRPSRPTREESMDHATGLIEVQ
jgi:hypothetical protein